MLSPNINLLKQTSEECSEQTLGPSVRPSDHPQPTVMSMEAYYYSTMNIILHDTNVFQNGTAPLLNTDLKMTFVIQYELITFAK